MTVFLFLATALVIVTAGVRIARYGDVIAERTGMGRSWIGLVLIAATTSLPELFTGIGATLLRPLPDIAVGDVLGSCMFNLLILSLMDAIQPEPLAARVHQSHALSIGFGLVLMGLAGLAIFAGPVMPAVGWVGLHSIVIAAVYLVAMRVVFIHEKSLRTQEMQEVVEELKYSGISTRLAVIRYLVAAAFVVTAGLALPQLGARLAAETGLGEAFVGSLFVAITTSLPEIVVSIAAVRIGAIDLGVANVLGSNLFNMLILALDDVLYLRGPLLAEINRSHATAVVAVMIMNGLFLVGLTHRVLTKRFVVTWDTGAIAAVYAVAIMLSYTLRS